MDSIYRTSTPLAKLRQSQICSSREKKFSWPGGQQQEEKEKDWEGKRLLKLEGVGHSPRRQAGGRRRTTRAQMGAFSTCILVDGDGDGKLPS